MKNSKAGIRNKLILLLLLTFLGFVFIKFVIIRTDHAKADNWFSSLSERYENITSVIPMDESQKMLVDDFRNELEELLKLKDATFRPESETLSQQINDFNQKHMETIATQKVLAKDYNYYGCLKAPLSESICALNAVPELVEYLAMDLSFATRGAGHALDREVLAKEIATYINIFLKNARTFEEVKRIISAKENVVGILDQSFFGEEKKKLITIVNHQQVEPDVEHIVGFHFYRDLWRLAQQGSHKSSFIEDFDRAELRRYYYLAHTKVKKALETKSSGILRGEIKKISRAPIIDLIFNLDSKAHWQVEREHLIDTITLLQKSSR